MKRLTLAQKDPRVAAEWHPTENGELTPHDVGVGLKTKFWWLCHKGHTWDTSIGPRVKPNNPTGCPFCAGQRAIPGESDLETTHPEVAAKWHPTANHPLTPKDVMAGANKIVNWYDQNCGHSWPQEILRFVNRPLCRVCHGRYLSVGVSDLATTHRELSKEWDYEVNHPRTPQQVTAGCNDKVGWIGKCGHPFEAMVASRTRDNPTGCPYCAMQELLPGFNDLETRSPTLAAEWHPTENGNLTPGQVLAGGKTKFSWLGNCGHTWKASIQQRLHRGQGCPTCAGHQVISGENDLASKFPEIAAEWHPTENGDLTPDRVGHGSTFMASWLRACGHTAPCTVVNRTANNAGCGVCNGFQVVSGINDVESQYPEVAVFWHPTANLPTKAYEVYMYSTRRKFTWRCDKGHEWETTPYSLTKLGTRCSRCQSLATSKIEQNLAAELMARGEDVSDENFIPVHWGKRKAGSKCDIVLRRHKAIIEYDGSYWHKEAQERDTKKTEALLNAGWKVIRIREKPLSFLEIRHLNLRQITYEWSTQNVTSLANQVINALQTIT